MSPAMPVKSVCVGLTLCGFGNKVNMDLSFYPKQMEDIGIMKVSVLHLISYMVEVSAVSLMFDASF